MSNKIFLVCLGWLISSCAVMPTEVPRGGGKASQSHVAPVRINHVSYNESAADLMMHAMSLIGTPYQYGGNDKITGFDCSGLVNYVYRQSLQVSLPRTTNDIAYAGIPVTKNSLRAGDLVFFNTTGKQYSHVGIYLGNNQFLHAPNRRSVVKVNSLTDSYWGKSFTGARTFFVR